MYTLPCLNCRSNKDLLSSTGNSAPCHVAAWMGRGFGGEWIHVYVRLSPFAVHLKLSPPGTSITDGHFHFSPATSLFLELLVIAHHSSPAVYWTPCNLRRGGIFQCHSFLPFHTVYGVLTARILEWFAISSSSGPHFVRRLHYDLSILHGVAHSFTELCKSLHHDKAVIHEGALYIYATFKLFPYLGCCK